MPERLSGNWFQGFRIWTSQSEASDQYLWWTAASIISAATIRRVWVRWNYTPIYPNMFIMLIGPPGSRKNRAIDFAREFTKELEIPFSAEATSKEGLIYNMSKNTILQTMGDSIFDTAPMYLISGDFMSFYRTSKESMVEWLTDLFDTEQYEHGWKYEVRSRDAEVIPKPYVNLLAGTTPSWMAQNFGEAFTEQGFSARTVFVYAHGPRQKIPRPRITPEMWDMRVRLLADLRHINTLYGELTVTPDAWDYFEKWYLTESGNERADYRLAHYFTRKPLHLWKLATIISVSDSDSMRIEPVHFDTALQALNAVEPLMLRAFSSVGRNPIANRTLMLHDEIAQRGSMKKSEIISLYGADLGLPQIDEALQALVLMKKIAPVASNGSGDLVYRLTGRQK
jgi:hypothetical protein